METYDKLFVNKYQPLYFNDYGKDHEIIKILKALLTMETLNILLVGDIASGKTSLLNILSDRISTGKNAKVKGKILINDCVELKGPAFGALASYVM